MTDTEATKAVRTLHRNGFNGVSLNVLKEFYRSVHLILFEKDYSHLDFKKAGLRKFDVARMFEANSTSSFTKQEVLDIADRTLNNEFYNQPFCDYEDCDQPPDGPNEFCGICHSCGGITTFGGEDSMCKQCKSEI